MDAKLREIAEHHQTLLKQIVSLSDADPEVDALKRSAAAAIDAGDYDGAQVLLEEAFKADIAAGNRVKNTANQRYITAAKTKGDLGQLKLSQLQYEAAAREFQFAADLALRAGELPIQALYLKAAGRAAYDAFIYPRAESAWT